MHLRQVDHRSTTAMGNHAAMAVLVDPLREYPDSGLRWLQWCHMVSDVSFDELHEFAGRLGIPRRGFQGDHYDLPPHVRERAVELGAREVGTGELVMRMAGARGDRARARRARA
jgi:hypothetical protein